MSNFEVVFKKGQLGQNFGLTTGILELDAAINGIQKGTSIGLVAAPKVGKTQFADFAFVINPYLEMEKLGLLDNMQWIYFSYEISRIKKEFKFAAFFMAYDHGIYNFIYKDKPYEMSANYLMGLKVHLIKDESGKIISKEFIPVTPEHEEILRIVYQNRIIPIFGEYSEDGVKIKPGKIRFLFEADNPTGMYKFLLHYAEKKGTFVTENFMVLNDRGESEARSRKVGWNPTNPDLHTIIILDHLRKLRRERGFTMKENMDKCLEYSTELRNLCNFTYVNIAHSNRGVANTDRLKFHGEFIYPTTDDTKDTGNLGEESNILMTLFNAGDEKYNLTKHFGVVLADYPNYRSLHVTESRDTFCPQHLQFNMYGGINVFETINKT